MSASSEQESPDQKVGDLFRVFVAIEPWEAWMQPEVELVAVDRDARKAIAHTVGPTGLPGVFVLEFDRGSGMKEKLEAGDVEIGARGRDRRGLGTRRIAQYRGAGPIAVEVRIVRPTVGRAATRISGSPNAIIDESAVHQLARKLAGLQGVGIREARAPRGIVQAIGELNRIAEVAAYSLTGDKAAGEALQGILGGSAFTSPGGLAGGEGGAGRGFGGGGPGATGLDAMVLDALGESRAAGRCGRSLSRAARVLDAAFVLDSRARNVDARWTRQAHAYVANRMRDVSAYVRSVDRAPVGSGRPGGDFPPGGDDFTTPVLPPDSGGDFTPPPPPGGGGFGSDVCAQLAELCLALYTQVLAAQLRDTYTDLIAAVAPNCLCSSYDPNQDFIARPQPGRTFDTPLPAGVYLHFGSRVITPDIVAPGEIHFKIPANARTGFVYLRAIGALPSQASQRLARACALPMPQTPAGILFDRSPAALISIIYPPVIASLTSDAGQQPAEACTPVEIRWHAHLLDQPASAPLHPCGGIDTILRDGQGNQVAAGGATGTVLETRADTTTYTLEAISRAGGAACGTAAPISLTVERVKYVYLERPVGPGMEQRGGTDGQLIVRISCPAPAGGQRVELTSSDPAVLRPQSPVTVAQGTDRLAVDFRTAAVCTAAPVRVTAASAGHTAAGPLEYNIYDVPVLQWAAGQPAQVLEGGPFSTEVDAACVPADSGRVNWWLIRTNPNNQQPPILLSAQRTSGQYPALRFRVELDTASARGLIAGDWELFVEIPDRANIRSPGLAFAVAQRPRFTITLNGPAEHTVVWDEETEYRLEVTGFDIPRNVVVPVNIVAQGLPLAFQVTPTPVTLTQANSGQRQGASLRLLSAAARGPIGTRRVPSFPFGIGASASGIQTPRSVQAAVTVKRQPGQFGQAQVRHNSASCSSSGRTINATVGGNGMARTVTFAIPTQSQTISSTRPAIFYAMSPKCRVGIAIPPVSMGTGPTSVDLINLGFEQGTGVSASLGGSIVSFQTFWQSFWFGVDDSLLVIIGRHSRSSAATTHFASLHDMITGQQLDLAHFSPAILQSPDNPTPFIPPAWMTGKSYAVGELVTQSAITYRCLVAHTSGVFAVDLADGKWVAEFLGETELQLAVINRIELVNDPSGDLVVVHFTNQNAAADSLELHV